MSIVNKLNIFKPICKEKFTTKEKDILNKNKNFYSTNNKYVDIMLEIINGESNISIRVLDWFVANFSKKNNTYYRIKINGIDEYFYVNNEYKNQLNGYTKEYFDPFCRKNKLIYTHKFQDSNILSSNKNIKMKSNKKEIKFISSIGQLNFFQWAIRNKIINYIERHLDEIEQDMKETSKKNKEKKIAMMEQKCSENEDEEIIIDDEPDPIICSSDKIKNLHISSPSKKISSNKSESEKKYKRQKLSKSVYEHGIKKSTIPIKLNFD